MTWPFKQDLVERLDLRSETQEDGKRWYVHPDGSKFKSVTTVLGEKLDKSGLQAWKDRVGPEEAERISREAAARGTTIHSIAENYVLGRKDWTKGVSPWNLETFNSIRRVLDKSLGTILGVELPLYSRALQTAGCTDLVAIFNNDVSIIDFKTSRYEKEEGRIEGYLLQSTVYSMMFEQLYKIRVPNIVIIIACDNGPVQVFKRNRSQYVEKVIEVFTT